MKKVEIDFTLAKMLEITAQYELIKLDDHKIYLKYATTNRPLKWFGKLLLLFSTDKVVIEFVERVKGSFIIKQSKGKKEKKSATNKIIDSYTDGTYTRYTI